MKKVLYLSVLGVFLAGCKNPYPLSRYDDAWWATKDSCAEGNYEACSEIGHMSPTAPQVTQSTYSISQPIID